MSLARYLILEESSESGGYSRVGGLPTHLPVPYPIHEPTESLATYEPLCFIAQFDLKQCGVTVDGVRYLQLYRAAVDYDPEPYVVSLPEDTKVNTHNEGRPCPEVQERSFRFEDRVDPEQPLEYDIMDFVNYGCSKVGGTTLYPDYLQSRETYLMQFYGDEYGVNFADRCCLIFLNTEGKIEAKLC